MRRVVVHIDRLVLKNFHYEDRHAVAGGLSQELGRLIAEPGVARHLTSRTDTARLEGGKVHITSGMQPIRIGTYAARKIAREIKS
jgi:hypothetical protein